MIRARQRRAGVGADDDDAGGVAILHVVVAAIQVRPHGRDIVDQHRIVSGSVLGVVLEGDRFGVLGFDVGVRLVAPKDFLVVDGRAVAVAAKIKGHHGVVRPLQRLGQALPFGGGHAELVADRVEHDDGGGALHGARIEDGFQLDAVDGGDVDVLGGRRLVFRLLFVQRQRGPGQDASEQQRNGSHPAECK